MPTPHFFFPAIPATLPKARFSKDHLCMAFGMNGTRDSKAAGGGRASCAHGLPHLANPFGCSLAPFAEHLATGPICVSAAIGEDRWATNGAEDHLLPVLPIVLGVPEFTRRAPGPSPEGV